MPLLCPGGFDTCTTTLDARERLRKPYTDGTLVLYMDHVHVLITSIPDAYPGYFTQTLDNDIKIEATATRRAGLERFTFPTGTKPYFVVDLANDLPNSFAGGTLDIDPAKGRIMIGGHYGSRWCYLSALFLSSLIVISKFRTKPIQLSSFCLL